MTDGGRWYGGVRRVVRLTVGVLIAGALVVAWRGQTAGIPVATPPAPTGSTAVADDGGGWGEGAWALIGAATGATLGVALSAGFTLWREGHAEHKQRDAVRTLLSIEADENLGALRDRWSTITRLPSREGAHYAEDQPTRLARRLVSRPMPPWSSLMWEGNSASLKVALNLDEIRTVYRMYADLEEVSGYRSRLAAVEQADVVADQTAQEIPSSIRGAPATRLTPPVEFPNYARAWWPEIERLVNGLLERGNPLEPVAEPATSPPP